jgi:hypothetical protein
VRARYLIPAAALVAAAYLKGRHDRLAGFPPPLAHVPVPPAPEQAPAVPELVLAEAEVAAGAEPTAAEPSAPESPDVEADAEPDATGRVGACFTFTLPLDPPEADGASPEPETNAQSVEAQSAPQPASAEEPPVLAVEQS